MGGGTVSDAILESLEVGLDRVAFGRRCGIEPDPWQVRALRSEHPRMLFNCSRQSGKTSVAAVLAAHEALYRPNSLVLMVSRSLDHSSELFRKALAFYRKLGRPVPPTSETALTLTLENGSRLVARPGASDTAMRGYSASLLLVDEVARVGDDLWAAATPIVAATGGRVVALSTPYGRRGWWYEEWSSGRDWLRLTATADEVPRITEAFLAEERSRKTEREYRQEYFGEFEEGEDQLFRNDLIERAFVDTPGLWADFAVDGVAQYHYDANVEQWRSAEDLALGRPKRTLKAIEADMERAIIRGGVGVDTDRLLREYEQAKYEQEAMGRG